MKTSALLNFVFNCAIQDRESMADAWGEDTPEGKEALKEAESFKALRKKLLPGVTPIGIKALIAASDGQTVTLKELRARSSTP